jgi:predicted ATPase
MLTHDERVQKILDRAWELAARVAQLPEERYQVYCALLEREGASLVSARGPLPRARQRLAEVRRMARIGGRWPYEAADEEELICRLYFE